MVLFMQTKRWLWCLLLFFCFVTFGSDSYASSTRLVALNRYRMIMNKKPDTIRFAVLNLDSDNIPEMIVKDYTSDNNKYFIENYTIYSYKNGRLVERKIDDEPFIYWEKKNVFSSAFGYYSSGLMCSRLLVRYYHIEGGKSVEFAEKVEYKTWGDKGKTDTSLMCFKIEKNGEKIELSKKSLRDLLKKYVKKTKSKRIKYHKNTVKNRKRFLDNYKRKLSIKKNNNT